MCSLPAVGTSFWEFLGRLHSLPMSVLMGSEPRAPNPLLGSICYYGLGEGFMNTKNNHYIAMHDENLL